jgi:hypothetical protein
MTILSNYLAGGFSGATGPTGATGVGVQGATGASGPANTAYVDTQFTKAIGIAIAIS